jgi:hypothetical protein
MPYDCVVELLLESVAAFDACYRGLGRDMSGSHGGSSHACENDRNQDHKTSHRFLGSGLLPAVLPLPISSTAVLGPDLFARFSRLQNFVACLFRCPFDDTAARRDNRGPDGRLPSPAKEPDQAFFGIGLWCMWL